MQPPKTSLEPGLNLGMVFLVQCTQLDLQFWAVVQAQEAPQVEHPSGMVIVGVGEVGKVWFCFDLFVVMEIKTCSWFDQIESVQKG